MRLYILHACGRWVEGMSPLGVRKVQLARSSVRLNNTNPLYTQSLSLPPFQPRSSLALTTYPQILELPQEAQVPKSEVL
jgi:hypothetical protein